MDESLPFRTHPRRKAPPRFRVPSVYGRLVKLTEALIMAYVLDGNPRHKALRSEAWAIYYRHGADDAVSFLERVME